MTEVVTIEKLVHGGQGIGTLADGRRVFVWNALPGEEVVVTITKKKRNLAEGIATEIVASSPERVEPKDAAYLSTSPWQMMSFDAENQHKQAILTETLQREHVNYDQPIAMVTGGSQWNYRNKMEYSFWADDAGLHLALFNRGSHQKQIIEGSSIAMSEVDSAAKAVLSVLNMHAVRGSQLKSVIIRANQAGETVVALFVKDDSFPELAGLRDTAKGVAIYYSTPKSPASVITKQLYQYGDISLTDTILDTPISYDVNSFFQVNLGVFEKTIKQIEAEVANQKATDMYAGVGTIGIPTGAVRLVEIDAHNIKMAKHNVGSADISIIEAAAERATDYIPSDGPLIVDPPRAGLHAKMTEALLEVLPPKIVYLSCNPITQARDLALLQGKYQIKTITGYNFFPRTPHIESLAILELLDT